MLVLVLAEGREHGAQGQLWDGMTASDPWKAWLPFLKAPGAPLGKALTELWSSAVDKAEALPRDRMGRGVWTHQDTKNTIWTVKTKATKAG